MSEPEPDVVALAKRLHLAFDSQVPAVVEDERCLTSEELQACWFAVARSAMEWCFEVRLLRAVEDQR